MRNVCFVVLSLICVLIFPAARGNGHGKTVTALDTGTENDGTAPQEVRVVREYYPSGNLKSETPFSGAVINGKKIHFYESGVVKMEEEYKDGMREGVTKEYYEDGALRMQETYREDKRNGECFVNYPGGSKMMAGRCVDDRKTGKWTMYHTNGAKYMEGTYSDDLMEGAWTTYAPEGWLVSEGEYRKGAQEGLWTYYDKYKKITRKMTLSNGIVDGPCWIYSQGRVTGEGIMSGKVTDPKKNGHWKSYYKNGRIKLEGSFTEGKKNGAFKEYHSNGNLKSSGEYQNDRRHGNWMFYDKDGKTINRERSGLYHMGKLSKKIGAAPGGAIIPALRPWHARA